MTNVKVQCSLCGNTNTKFEGEYAPSGFLGLSSTKVGEHEVIDPDARDYYRCLSCGRFYCEACFNKNCNKIDRGFLTTKRWTQCPKPDCGGTVTKI
jgi:hypothetical protein